MNYLTDRQQKFLQAYYDCNKDVEATACRLGEDYNTVRMVIYRIKKKMDKAGVVSSNITNPGSEITISKNNPPVSEKNDSEVVKSTSTLYDKNGNIINKWVKADTSKSTLKNLAKKFIEEYSTKLPKYDPQVSGKKFMYEDKLIVYPIADAHLGMLSWFNETKNNYNTKIADETIRRAITSLVLNSPSCQECLICNLGDFLHVDNLFNKTPKNENILDVDSRYAKILNVAIRLMRYVIEYSLVRHKHVTVVNCIGNHDPIGSLWLNAALQNIYSKEKRITILDNSSQRLYYRYYNNLFGMCHGSEIKDKDLPLLMATEEKEDWGDTDFHYWFLGHWHHNKSVDVCGCNVEAFSPICAKDAYAISKGYNSKSKMQYITFDKNDGEKERYSVYLKY